MRFLDTSIRKETWFLATLALGFVLETGPAHAQSPAAGRQWVVIIAIQDYENLAIPDLSATLRDAQDLKETLIKRAGVDSGDILEMTDRSQPTCGPPRITSGKSSPRF